MGLALEMKFTGTAELEVVMVPLLLRVNQHHQTTLWKAAVLPAYKATKTSEQTVLYLPGTQRSL